MGQTLSEPVTTKESASCQNSKFTVGSSSMQGWRINMEDAHTHLLALPDDPSTAFFAVYDGHGGARVSQYAGIHLHKCITEQPEYKEGKIEEAIKKGFLALDEKMKEDEDMKDDVSGTTAVVALVNNDRIYCGNVGDSRAIMSINGVAQPLSYDHKPANDEEAKRIVSAGGWVEFNRVNGNLALSRALGDFAFKKNMKKTAEEQMVTAFPDVITEPVTPSAEFMILACDGIWDVMSNQEVIDFCRERLAVKKPPHLICEELLSRCLAPDCQMGGLGCDNMTAVLVGFTQGKGAEGLAERCAAAGDETTGAAAGGGGGGGEDEEEKGGEQLQQQRPPEAPANPPPNASPEPADHFHTPAASPSGGSSEKAEADGAEAKSEDTGKAETADKHESDEQKMDEDKGPASPMN